MKNIGLDIGGTSIKGAVVDGDKIVKTVKVDTDAKNGIEAVKRAVFRCIDALLPFCDKDFGIGVGSAGDINPITGEVVYSTGNIPGYTGTNLKSLLENKYEKTVAVVNDAYAALIGETVYGAARGARDVVMLTLGTGLGGAAVVNGALMTGHGFRAGRLGHVTLYPGGRACNCGLAGCAEQYVSATGLKKTAAEFGIDENNCNVIFEKAATEKAFADALDVFLGDLALVCRNTVNIFDPEKLIIGGGLVEAKEIWWDAFFEKLAPRERAAVVPAELGNKAGFLGSGHLLNDNNLLQR